ncbi:hypothetical protein LY76DRAFT_64151 [Colletotrichum caudatum]|nr:hypothetical protein LY76DRAFT_64151 [Colletotrichum caudatum]
MTAPLYHVQLDQDSLDASVAAAAGLRRAWESLSCVRHEERSNSGSGSGSGSSSSSSSRSRSGSPSRRAAEGPIGRMHLFWRENQSLAAIAMTAASEILTVAVRMRLQGDQREIALHRTQTRQHLDPSLAFKNMSVRCCAV